MGGIARPLQTYNDGKPYRLARGMGAPRDAVEDLIARSPAVVLLPVERPSAGVFVRRIQREMKIRFYRQKTIKLYRCALSGFLRWLGKPPHEATREDVRNFLEVMVDGGASRVWVGIHLSAIRTAFDKMCGETITFGLQAPRRNSKLPVVLSKNEVLKLLKGAPSLRDKLLIGLMYATGMRVSETCRLRWRDIDFDRRVVCIRDSKGRRDREVMLPASFEALLNGLSKNAEPEDFLFPGPRRGRYLSRRTASRAIHRAASTAGLSKHVTAHVLRHSFATHLLENGTDIRFIQKLLGHVRLETTTIYLRLAKAPSTTVASPLDEMVSPGRPKEGRSDPGARGPSAVGVLRIEMEPLDRHVTRARARLRVGAGQRPVYLTGIRLQEVRPGYLAIELPPLEAWERDLARLSEAQRARITAAPFYEMLQRELTRRLLALRNGRAARAGSVPVG